MSSPATACKKKLYLPPVAPLVLPTHRTRRKIRDARAEPRHRERAVRQLLADKVNGNLLGLWLLLPEHLRLGSWSLLQSWTGGDELAARLGLQLSHEAVLCVSGVRERRSLSQRGFELANGLPFVATDVAIHELLNQHTVAQAQRLQVGLGKMRRSFGHFTGRLLVIDPHRLPSCSQRQMLHLRKDRHQPPCKVAQTFFCLDAETQQPVCFTSASAARTVSQASPELLQLGHEVLGTPAVRPLVLADTEHYTVEFVDWMAQSPMDLLVPMPLRPAGRAAMRQIPAAEFRSPWPGYATAQCRFRLQGSQRAPDYQWVQRTGEQPAEWQFKAFLCTADRDEVAGLTQAYPQRWHIEQFFDNAQALGWDRAGTLNLNIRYGKMSLALFAQASSYMLRQRLGPPFNQWDAAHLAKDFFRALEADLRVDQDTIYVTFYNAPQAEKWKQHYENLPAQLAAEGVDPRIPWLYDYKLDFRFK